MNETPIDAGNDLGRFIQSEMNRRGWSLRDAVTTAAKKNKRPFSYEHLRKIIKGNTQPSADVLEKIAKTFDMEPSVLLTIHHKSTIARKYGPDYLESMNITPEMYEIDSLMKSLSPDQRKFILIQIKALVNDNIAAGNIAPVKTLVVRRGGEFMKRRRA
jgi:hypothetical protein